MNRYQYRRNISGPQQLLKETTVGNYKAHVCIQAVVHVIGKAAFLERRIRFIIKIKRTVSCMILPGAILSDSSKLLAKLFPHFLRRILQ